MRALVVLLLWGSSAAAAPEGGVYDPMVPALDARTQGAVSLGLVTELHFATDNSAIQAGAGARLIGGLDVGVVVVDRFELVVGYRWLTPLDSADELVTTDGHRVILGPRLHASVSDKWAFVFALEGEATFLDLAVTLPENSGGAGAWAFGVTPGVGIDGAFPLGDDAAFGFRGQVGWAFRTAHEYHAVRLRAEGADVAPLDMGDLNLSGFEVGISVRVAFR